MFPFSLPIRPGTGSLGSLTFLIQIAYILYVSFRNAWNNLANNKQKLSLLQLPVELRQMILATAWTLELTRKEQILMMTSLPMVCKDISESFHIIWQRDVRIPSESFYNYYMSRIKELPRSHAMNTRCVSFQFWVENEFSLMLKGPLRMDLSADKMAYFYNGKDFSKYGFLPNLQTVFINIHNFGIRDPYQALFPVFMPKSVQTVNIHYSFSTIEYEHIVRDLDFQCLRITPIRYLASLHCLKRLVVSGLGEKTEFIRLWATLFKVEELIVNGQWSPVLGEDAPWGLNIHEAYNMIEMGCMGIGWNWQKAGPQDARYYCNLFCSMNDDELASFMGNDNADSDLASLIRDYALAFFMGDEDEDLTDDENEDTEEEDLTVDENEEVRLRRYKSLPNLRDFIGKSTCLEGDRLSAPVGLKRSKTYTELPILDYPYEEFLNFPRWLLP